LAAIGFGDPQFQMTDDAPWSATWTCLVPQHTAPIPWGAFVRIWDDAANDPSGTPFSESNPIFEGYVEAVTPGDDSIGVNYTAYAPTYRATKVCTIFSKAWPAGTVPDEPPLPPEASVPRLVYNVRISNDPDWAHQVGGDGTLGQVIAGLLEYCYHSLVWCDAAPGDGVEGWEDNPPYVQAEMDALTVKCQEKLDFQSESVFSAIQRIRRYDPRLRLVWEPGTRLWHVRNLTTAPAKSIWLNRRDVAFPVLSMQLKPSTEQCVTAVSIYGPEQSETVDLRWDDPNGDGSPSTSSTTLPPEDVELIPLGDPVVIQNYTTALGAKQARFWSAWQIADEDLRRGARELPTPYEYQVSPTMLRTTSYPLVLCSWDTGLTWTEWPAYYNTRTGIIRFPSVPVFGKTNEKGESLVPASTQTLFVPNAMRVIWAPYEEPLQVRRPAVGFEGTAYTQAGIAIEDYHYDEALAVGYEDGQPVTTAERRAAFETYAQTLLDQRKNIAWTGGAQLDGLDWSYSRLHRRVRILAKDGDGNTLTTGWEGIEAYVTSVTYDLENQTTTLVFSGDRLALFGMDEGQLKQQLNIKALQQVADFQVSLIHAWRPLPSGKMVREVVGVQTTRQYHYVEPGSMQAPASQDFGYAPGSMLLDGGGL